MRLPIRPAIRRNPPSEPCWIACLFPYKHVPLFLSFLIHPAKTWRWLKNAQPIRFTTFGVFYILFAIGIGAAAINTGNNLLYLVLGIQLSFIVISGFLSDSTLWGLRLRWHAPATLFAQQSAIWRVEATKGWFPSVLTWVDASWSAASCERVWLPWVRQSTLFVSHPVQPSRRGWLTLQSVRLGTPFPFGLFEKTHFHETHERWVVYPQILPEEALPQVWRRVIGDENPAQSSTGGGSVPFYLRDYVMGDPSRRIHWKATARRQQLTVKEMEDEHASGSFIEIPEWPVGLNPFEQERLIAQIGSALWHGVRNGIPMGLHCPERQFPLASTFQALAPALRFLAFVEPTLWRPHAPNQ